MHDKGSKGVCKRWLSAMHDQFMKFPTEGAFKYSVVLVYMFIYHQTERFPFTL